MPLSLYRVLHLIGLFLVYLGLGAQAAAAKEDNPKDHFIWKTAGMTHGIGMLLSLIGGFGLLAKLGIAWPWPIWVWAMLVSWLALGAAPVFAKKSPAAARKIWLGSILLGLISAVLGATKPF
jgi:hypothetical protein